MISLYDFVCSFVFLWRAEKLLISVPCFPCVLLLYRTHVESRVVSTAKSWFASSEPVTRKLFPPTQPGESGVLRGGGPQVATCHIFLLAVCQSVVCGTILYPRSALSSEKSREAVVPIYTIIDRVSFCGFIYRMSLSGLRDIRSFVTESALTTNRKKMSYSTFQT